jgi:CTP synthase
VNNSYREQLELAGLIFSGQSADGSLVEFVELPVKKHPYFISTQAHPELRSRPNRAHPLFRGLVAAALERHNSSVLFAVTDQAS